MIENVPYVPEKNVYSNILGWKALYKSISPSSPLKLLNLLYNLLVNLSNSQSAVLKSLTYSTFPSMFFTRYMRKSLIYLPTKHLVHISWLELLLLGLLFTCYVHPCHNHYLEVECNLTRYACMSCFWYSNCLYNCLPLLPCLSSDFKCVSCKQKMDGFCFLIQPSSLCLLMKV